MIETPEHHTKLQILAEEVKNCTKCKLHQTRLQTVFSRGNPDALVCFEGEGPGEDEDKQGKPFVGKSGQLLDTAIKELGYNTETDIYVCNTIKCRPPNNRRPETDEIQSCYPYLEQQLELIKAKVIITLGSTAMQVMTDETKGITKARGNWHKWKDKEVIVLWHPSYILRNGGQNSKMYAEWKDDIKIAFDKAKSMEV